MGAPFLALAWGVFVFLPGWLRPSVSRARVLTAKVERGPVEAMIEASGTVLPAREKVLSSPIETRVLRILKRPGDPVRRGEALLELDTEATKLDLERLQDRLAQKRNEQLQARLTLERSLDDLRGQIQKAELDEQILDARHERDLRMRTDGLISEDALKESEVEAHVLRNAMEAIGEDGRIAVRLSKDGGRASLSVTDTGCGILPDARSNLFTPFFNTKREGRGLGLTVVREILAGHRFEFSLEGLPEGGAEFRIRF